MKVAIIGGDKRMLFCAKEFCDDNYFVTMFGFDKLQSNGPIKISNDFSSIACFDIVVFPYPLSTNKNSDNEKKLLINAPFSKQEIYIEDILDFIKDKIVFCSNSEKLKKYELAKVYDYSKNEHLLTQNAELTSEGALQTAMQEYEGSIFKSRCLVCGFGRIGKILSKMLFSLNADTCVFARKEKDRAMAESFGIKTLSNLENCSHDFDIIFNTVPALIIDKKVIDKLNNATLIIDLASYPGGVDFDYAKKNNVDVIHALKLPGICAPKSAGTIIKNTIIRMTKEDPRWKRLA